MNTKIKMMKYLLVLIAMLSLNQIQCQTFSGNHKDIEMILKNTENFSSYVMASDYDNIYASYTSNAKIFPNNADILEGKDIIKYWTLPEGLSTSHHKITQSEITIVDDTAYDYGYYEGITKNVTGEEKPWGGKYVIVWKKENGDWKMYLDIWNNIKKK